MGFTKRMKDGRLTTRMENGKACYACSFEWKPEDEQTILDKLADLEDEFESGQIIRFPCKPGTKVYIIGTNGVAPVLIRRTILQFIVLKESVFADVSSSEKHTRHLLLENFNKTWYISKELAKAKLEDLKRAGMRGKEVYYAETK